MKYINKIKRNQKSVQSVHPCKSVIQTSYDIVKAHGGELKVETRQREGKAFSIILPLQNLV
jgi:K+-sensing histidine kinase KdpD